MARGSARRVNRNWASLSSLPAVFLRERSVSGKQHNLSGDLGLFQQFVGAGGFAKRKFNGDDWQDFFVLQKSKQFCEIFAEPVGMGVTKSFDVVPAGALAIGN